jgi:hypothetical protein
MRFVACGVIADGANGQRDTMLLADGLESGVNVVAERSKV